MSNYLSKIQEKKSGFIKIGKNCKISNKIRTYSLNCIIGNNVRIDDDVILKGKIKIGSNVHIARGCTLSGGEKGIYLNNFATLSNFCQLFTESDDYYNSTVSGGTFDKKKRHKFCSIISKKISIGKASIIGPFGVILPGADIGDFCTVAPFSCIYKKIKDGYYLSTSQLTKIFLKKRNIKKLKKIYEKNFKNY